MDLEEFNISFSSLKAGSNPFSFEINKMFFEFFNPAFPFDGTISIDSDIRKETHLLDIRMKLSGESSVSCDRCLDKIILHFNQSYQNYIKFDHVEEEVIKDDVIFIPYESYEYNIAFIIYENFMLNYPKRNIHKDNHCNPEQVKIIEAYSNSDHSHKFDYDPRWDALKKLKEN